MNHRKLLIGVAVAAVGAGGTGTALAAGSAAPAKVTVKSIPGKTAFKPNRYIQDGLRFDRDVYTVRSGGTLTLKHGADQEGPHTLTVLKKNQVPTTLKALTACENGAKNSACTPFQAAHQFNPQTGAVGKPIVDAHKAGLDGAGDSVYIDPAGPTSTRSIKVSAKKGSTLYFICLVHPWMQARIAVK